jgi:recombination protein RecR
MNEKPKNTLERLILQLQKISGIGPKSAQRMAYELLNRRRELAFELGETLIQAAHNLQNCIYCNQLTEPSNICHVCDDKNRLPTQLCIVENPSDYFSLEQMHMYQGLYFILMGNISPLKGIGPKDLSFDKLLQRISYVIREQSVQEIIIATGFSTEGEMTAHLLEELLKPITQKQGIALSRLARGVPVGSDLEYVDAGTLAFAFHDRKKLI